MAVGAYFGQEVQSEGIVDRLLGEQMSDGGWNCEQERGSTRGSSHTTICVLEGLLEYVRLTGGGAKVFLTYWWLSPETFGLSLAQAQQAIGNHQ